MRLSWYTDALDLEVMTLSHDIRQRLVITADDYGLRQSAEPILRLVRQGKVDRVAVMIHYVTPEAIAALRETGIPIDLHLDLIELMGRGDQPDQSTLRRGASFTLRYFLGRIRPQAVEAEWRMQLQLFRERLGRLPDGLNSHEHVHYFPAFFRIITRLAVEERIPTVRFGLHGTLLRLHHSTIGHILQRFFRSNRRVFLASGLGTTHYLVGYDWIRNFRRFLKQLPREGRVELVVHPERPQEYAFLERHVPAL